MAIIFGKLKCIFCGKKNGLLHSVHGYGIYKDDMGKRIFYHSNCLEMIEMEPEKFGHAMADKALYIHELKEKNEQDNIRICKKYKATIDKLNQKNFERLMPKQF